MATVTPEEFQRSGNMDELLSLLAKGILPVSYLLILRLLGSTRLLKDVFLLAKQILNPAHQPGDDISVEGEDIGEISGNPRDMGRALRSLLEEA